MWNSNVVSLLCLFVIGTLCLIDENVGKGKWKIINIMKCPDEAQYPHHLDVKRRKMNRTHDVFSLYFDVPEKITETSHGVYAELCRKVDGGCKTQLIFDEDSLCGFFNKYAKDNFERGLTNAGVDPPNCPIPAGPMEIKEILFNYGDLPEQGFIGDFFATFHLTKDNERLNCIMADLNFAANLY